MREVIFSHDKTYFLFFLWWKRIFGLFVCCCYSFVVVQFFFSSSIFCLYIITFWLVNLIIDFLAMFALLPVFLSVFLYFLIRSNQFKNTHNQKQTFELVFHVHLNWLIPVFLYHQFSDEYSSQNNTRASIVN